MEKDSHLEMGATPKPKDPYGSFRAIFSTEAARLSCARIARHAHTIQKNVTNSPHKMATHAKSAHHPAKATHAECLLHPAIPPYERTNARHPPRCCSKALNVTAA